MTGNKSQTGSETETQVISEPISSRITNSKKKYLYTIDNSGKSCDGTESGAMEEDSDEETEYQPRYRELAPRPLDKTNTNESSFSLKESIPILNKPPPTQAYYNYDGGQSGLVKCSACTRAYKPSTRIDTLMRHLSKKHGFFQPGRLASDSEKPFLSPVSSLSQKPTPSASSLQLEEAAVSWILEDSLSLTALESPAFKRLINLIAPTTALPSTPRLRELFSSMLATSCLEGAPTKILKTDSHSPSPVTIVPVPVGVSSASDPKSVSNSISPD